MNIVTEWRKRNKVKKLSTKEAVDNLNRSCGYKYRVSEISSMERGERNIPACVHSLMLTSVLLTALEEAGWDNAIFAMTDSAFLDLCEKLSPPTRKPR